MVEAEVKHAATHNKSILRDAGASAFGSRITMVEAEALWWRLKRGMPQNITHQPSKMLGPERSETGSLWWRLKLYGGGCREACRNT